MKIINEKILVIEDDDEQWFLISKALKRWFSSLIAVRAASHSEVIKLLHQWENQEWDLPRLIIQDLYLPTPQQGFELLSQLKAQNSPCRLVPVLVISASNRKTDIATSYQLGASSYMVKPLLENDWVAFFEQLGLYWWETVTLPPLHFRPFGQ